MSLANLILDFKLAWRNLWRNKRRTLITAASIFFAVFLALLINSMQSGTWQNMLDSVIGNYIGYGQIHKAGYWDEQTIDNTMAMISMDSIPDPPSNLEDLIPRLESFAWVTSDTRSRGAVIIGIDPDKEKSFIQLDENMVRGDYLEKRDKSLLVGEGMAKILKVDVNDTLVLLGQGYHGVNAVGKYPVKGIVKFGNPDLNKRVIFLPLKETQWLYGAENRVSTLVVQLKNNGSYLSTINSLKKQLPDKYEVMHWKELVPELVQAMQADKGGNYIMLFIIYLIIGFGIFATVLMMTAERQHEFGVLIAIGMKRSKISRMVFIESVILSILGVLAGVVMTLPIILYFAQNPIMLGGDMAAVYEEYGFEPMYVFSKKPSLFLNQVLLVLGINLIVVIYPLAQLLKMDAIKAMRS